MKSSSVPAEVFGYLVCLLAVVIFFISVAGVVNNGFRVVNPAARPPMMAGGGMHHDFGGNFPWMGRRELQSQGSPIATAPMRDRFIANARFDAVRRLVVALVMLVLSVMVFRRTFGWLNPKTAAA